MSDCVPGGNINHPPADAVQGDNGVSPGYTLAQGGDKMKVPVPAYSSTKISNRQVAGIVPMLKRYKIERLSKDPNEIEHTLSVNLASGRNAPDLGKKKVRNLTFGE
ncbi:MAG: hypothetical protein K2L13_01315 [Opitutales bacterium]|nr:hypothetical protein [Opitutales bacterium]